MNHTVKHIVLFRPGNRVSQAAVAALFNKVGRLKNMTPGFQSIFIGCLESECPMAKGFAYGMVLSFDSQSAVNAFVESANYRPLIREMQRLFDMNEDMLVINLPGNYALPNSLGESEAAQAV